MKWTEFEQYGWKKLEEATAYLDKYIDPKKQASWWPELVHMGLGNETSIMENSQDK